MISQVIDDCSGGALSTLFCYVQRVCPLNAAIVGGLLLG